VITVENGRVKLCKPKMRKPAPADLTLFANAITVVLTIAFAYFMYFFINPIALEVRYLHPLMPVLLMMLGVFVSSFLAGKDCEKKEDELLSTGAGAVRASVTVIVLAVTLLFGLLDFKQYRSEVKVQDACTAEVLEIMGETTEETGLVSVGVKHLAWTVFEHYFPESPVYGSLRDIPETASDVWVFFDPVMPESDRQDLEARGYTVTGYMDKNFGKYHCNLYHLKK
jgi:hypothetical protein